MLKVGQILNKCQKSPYPLTSGLPSGSVKAGSEEQGRIVNRLSKH